MHLFHKKNKLSISLGIIMSAVIFILFITFFITHKNYDQQGANIKNFSTTTYLSSEKQENLFEQTFIAKNDELNKIIFYYKNKERTNKLELSILDVAEKKVIRQETFIIQAKDNAQILNWDFENIEEAKNKKYSLLISPEKNNLELMTTPADLYVDGQLKINGIISTEDILAFSFDYQANNLFPILQNRLGIYKPGIFNTAWAFDILFIAVVLLIGYLTYLVATVILRKD